MDIRTSIDAAARAAEVRQKQQTVPQNLAAEGRFRDILTLLQDDGLVSQNAAVPALQLSAEQKQQLRDGFDITNMPAYADKRALLNELVDMGVLSAEESELSMMQLLPPQGGAVVSTGLGITGSFATAEQNALLEEMLSEPNYLSYLQKAIQLDGAWARSQDVMGARQKLYGLLQDIFI